MRTLTALALAFSAAACDGPARLGAPVVHWTATAGAPDTSSNIDVFLAAEVDSGWKVYALTQRGTGPIPLAVSVPPAAAYAIVDSIRGPDALRATDPNFGIETETYSGSPAFRLKLKRTNSGDTSTPIDLLVTSQACSDRICLPQRTDTVRVRVDP